MFSQILLEGEGTIVLSRGLALLRKLIIGDLELIQEETGSADRRPPLSPAIFPDWLSYAWVLQHSLRQQPSVLRRVSVSSQQTAQFEIVAVRQ